MSGRHLHHPDVHPAWSEWSESETVHVAVAYSNPCRWRARRKLLNDFRRHMASFPNVQLHVGELAYADRPFEVTGAETDQFHHRNDLQFRSPDELWHKENLINAIVARFPADWRYGAYVDGDFVFTRQDWAIEAIHLLQHYDFVQLFSSYIDLDANHFPYRHTKSFVKSYLDGQFDPDNPGGYQTQIRGGFGGAVATGGAWAFRRSAFDAVGGLLDSGVLGSGDWHMALGLVAGNDAMRDRNKFGTPMQQAIHRWQQQAAKLHGNIGCLNQLAVHHFHGSKKNRGYGSRDEILRRHGFDPLADIVRDWQGIYRWAGNKPGLRQDVLKYFLSRSEDDPTLTDHRSI